LCIISSLEKAHSIVPTGCGADLQTFACISLSGTPAPQGYATMKPAVGAG